MIHILTNTETILKIEVRPQESRIGDESVKGVLSLQLKQVLTDTSFTEQQYYLQSSVTAAYVSFNKLDQRTRYRASVNLVACNDLTFNFTQGSSSSGLGYALACFDAWWRLSLTKDNHFEYPIFATGEVLTSGQINPIGHIIDKIESVCTYVEEIQPSISNFYFCYPLDNDAEIPHILRDRLSELGGELIPSNRLQHTLRELLGSAYDGDPLGRWLPFKGLSSFEYEDSVRFFGRDKDVARIYNDVEHNNGLLIVSGASGTGKSSLIKAGLIPKLEKVYGYLYWATCTPNTLNASQGILSFILHHLIIAWDIKTKNLVEITSIFETSVDDGLKFFKSQINDETKNCLLYLDQYEEVFSNSELNNDDVANQLSVIDLLAKSLVPLSIVLALRNEYLGRLLDSQALRSPIISNVASKLTYKEWQSIVHDQAMFSGINFEVNFSDKQSLDTLIIEEAIQVPYALPMVSFLLEQLYIKSIKDEGSSTTLLYKHYNDLGGLTGAIAHRASKVIQDHNPSDSLMSQFFDCFIGINPQGIPFTRQVILSKIQQSDNQFYSLIVAFIDSNLITNITNDTHETLVKLAHDSLFDKWDQLKEWIERSKEYLLWRYNVDGTYFRWQQAKIKKNDHLIQDVQLIKDGRKYQKSNLIFDENIDQYFTLSLKSKRKKKYSLIFTCVVLPILLISLYQWDKTRTKISYYSAIGEKWSVPFGINKLTDEQVKHRTASYRFESQSGMLRRLTIINSMDVLVKDESRGNDSSWEYFYNEDGRIQSKIIRNNSDKIVNKINFTFDRLNNSTVNHTKENGNLSFNKIKNSLQYMPYMNILDKRFMSTNSDISHKKLTYSNEGYLLKTEFRNPYGIATPINNKHYGILYSYNKMGLKKSKTLIDKKGNIFTSYDQNKYNEYFYDYFGNITEDKRTTFDDQSYSYKRYYDGWGNLVKQEIMSNGKPSSIYKKIFQYVFELDSSGNIISYIYLDVNKKIIAGQYGIAVTKNKYDFKGRVIEQRFLDEIASLTPGKEGCARIQSEFDIIGNLTSSTCFDKSNKLSLNAIGCVTTKFRYDKNRNLIETKCLDRDNQLKIIPDIGVAKVVFYYNKMDMINEVHFYGVNDQAINSPEGFHKVEIIRDDNENIEERYFGIDGQPITVKGMLSRSKLKFDGRGNIIEQSYLDQDGHLTYIDGISKIKYKYDHLGREIEVSYFDEFDNPLIENYLNYHKKLTVYSIINNYIKSIDYLDINNKKLDLTTDNSRNKFIKNIDSNIYLRIKTSPDGSKIFINNKFSGVTPYNKLIIPGKYNLKIIKPGFKKIITTLNINNEADQSQFFYLESEVDNSVDLDNLRKNALLNQGISQLELGIYYTYSKNKNIELAKKWFKNAALNKVTKAMHYLGSIYLFEDSEIDKGIYWLTKAANSGLMDSQYLLGLEYLTGSNIPINDKKALELLSEAEKKGHIAAQFGLGRIYDNGWGVDEDDFTAFNWYSKAANKGHGPAITRLANMYSYGEGTLPDPYASTHWSTLGAELNIPESFYMLGLAYSRGEGAIKDVEAAIMWFEKALKSNHKIISPASAGFLGLIYGGELSSVSDFEKAVYYYSRSIDKGDFTSAFPLAYMYLKGYGVETDLYKAKALLFLSHEKGDQRATDWLIKHGEL